MMARKWNLYLVAACLGLVPWVLVSGRVFSELGSLRPRLQEGGGPES